MQAFDFCVNHLLLVIWLLLLIIACQKELTLQFIDFYSYVKIGKSTVSVETERQKMNRDSYQKAQSQQTQPSPQEPVQRPRIQEDEESIPLDVQISNENNDSQAPPYPEQQLQEFPRYKFDDFTNPFVYMTYCYVIAYIVLLVIWPWAFSTYWYMNCELLCGSIFALICIGCFLGGLFFEMRLLYRCWSVIQDGYAWTTPEKSIQFLYFAPLLFIPVINVYWLYVSMYGLSKCLNEYIKRHQLNVRPCSIVPMIITCVLYEIPFSNLVLPILFLPFALYSAMRTARDINRLK